MALAGLAAVLLPAASVACSPRWSIHRRYEQQIDRLQQRHLSDAGIDRLVDGEINLAIVITHRSEEVTGCNGATYRFSVYSTGGVLQGEAIWRAMPPAVQCEGTSFAAARSVLTIDTTATIDYAFIEAVDIFGKRPFAIDSFYYW